MSDIVVVNDQAKLTPVYSPQELFKLKRDLDAIIKENLIDGQDYGVIPGTKSKPSLWKSGAEKIAVAFGLHPDYEIVDSTIDHSIEMTWSKYSGRQRGTALGLYRYVVKCTLRNHRGDFLGSGIGICSSLENKYCDRPRDLENTINKMAQKRAFVAAILNTLALSNVFTQDIEDQVDIQKKEEDTPRPEQRSFDPGDKGHQDRLITRLNEANVAPEHWDDIAQKLRGTPLPSVPVRLQTIIGEVVGSNA
jgi:hypothetical protein